MSKEIKFISSCRDDLRKFPVPIKKEIGLALHLAQTGGRSLNAFSLIGFGSANVSEIKGSFEKATYRCVYTVQFEEVVYVLHAFKKKSKRGITTPKKDMNLIKSRLKVAERHYNENYRSREKRIASRSQ